MDNEKKINENKANSADRRKGFLNFLKSNGIYIVSGVALAFLLWMMFGYVQ